MANAESSSAEAASRSPSPPINPPRTSAPGPRATQLQRIFNDAVAHTLKTCSYSNFASCFPTPAQYVPDALGGLHRDFIGKLDEVCKNEFTALIEEREVVPSLNELDSLILDARNRQTRSEKPNGPGNQNTEGGSDALPPHLLPPSSLLLAHLKPFLSLQDSHLNEQLAIAQDQNKAIADDISVQRITIANLLKGLEETVSELESAAMSANGVDQVLKP